LSYPGKKHWSERLVCWSPRGAYLATFHRLGVQLWGGASWSRQLKLSHGGVRLINFSPCENFLVTWSPEGDPKEAFIIWDVKTGAKCRAFPGAGEEEVEVRTRGRGGEGERTGLLRVEGGEGAVFRLKMVEGSSLFGWAASSRNCALPARFFGLV
jgi:WD40 repeat protein